MGRAENSDIYKERDRERERGYMGNKEKQWKSSRVRSPRHRERDNDGEKQYATVTSVGQWWREREFHRRWKLYDRTGMSSGTDHFESLDGFNRSDSDCQRRINPFSPSHQQRSFLPFFFFFFFFFFLLGSWRSWRLRSSRALHKRMHWFFFWGWSASPEIPMLLLCLPHQKVNFSLNTIFYPSNYLPINRALHPSCLSFCKSVNISIYQSINLPIYLSIRLFICQSIYLSIYLFIHLAILLYIC